MHSLLRTVLSSAAIIGLAIPAGAEVQTTLAISNVDVGLVRQKRVVAVPNGEGKISLTGISSRADPETIGFESEGLTVLEQALTLDSPTSGGTYRSLVGQTVTVVRTDPKTGSESREEVEVVAENQGLVVRGREGMELLHPDGKSVRVLFQALPASRPPGMVLQLRVRSPAAGNRPAELMYLTEGLSWQAGYEAIIDPVKGTARIQGKATIENKTDVEFVDSHVRLVSPDQRLHLPYQLKVNSSRDNGGDGSAAVVKDPVTLPPGVTKQVNLFTADDVKVQLSYDYTISSFFSSGAPESVAVVARFANSKANGLGGRLLRGPFSFYVRDRAGESRFFGQTRFDGARDGDMLELSFGEASQITVKPTRLKSEPRQPAPQGNGAEQITMEYELKNGRDFPVEVEMLHQKRARDYPVVEASEMTEQVNAETVRWLVKVPAKSAKTLRVTFRKNIKTG